MKLGQLKKIIDEQLDRDPTLEEADIVVPVDDRTDEQIRFALMTKTDGLDFTRIYSVTTGANNVEKFVIIWPTAQLKRR